MMRFTFFTALIAVVLASMMTETQALASIVRNVRRGNAIWGKLTGRQSRDSGFPQIEQSRSAKVPVSAPRIASMPVLSTEESVPSSTLDFDADAFRREMTELVYERSMERFA